MSRLNFLFEEDIEMQDALEDIENLMDNSEDIIITAMEDRAEETQPGLFDNEDPVKAQAAEEHKKDLERLNDAIDDSDFVDYDDIDYALDDDDVDDYTE